MQNALCVFVLLGFIGAYGLVISPLPNLRPLLGTRECTWGPSYWCTNLTSAAGCRATKHCIQTVWLHQEYPVDDDSICTTCKDMVKQARDQLESNETQEEIKEVFEGSCKLIPLKPINEECCKLADQFIPDLIDTLASQMNPQVVCAVAGLCNNAKIDKMLENSKMEDLVVAKDPEEEEIDTCTGCHKVIDLAEQKFNALSKDEFLQKLLQVCGHMGSFSDACSNIVIVYFNEIYARMKNEFKADGICVMSGECSMQYHVHDSQVEITPMGKVGFVPVGTDDPTCKLCKQLVGHLRDLLIADTTEAEFERVLQGICKQTGNFKEECLSIVDQYYPMIYHFLVDELNSTTVCEMATICPGPGLEDGPVAPLIPSETKQSFEASKSQPGKLDQSRTEFDMQSPELMQLPIERLNSPHLHNIFSKEVCAFCEYFLHYAQQVIIDPKNERQIEDAVGKACERLPSSVNGTCLQFINAYGDALMALLAQEIDPSVICPLIRVCPEERERQDIEVFMQGTTDKPNCPLCLFAVTKLEEIVKDAKTKDNIKNALENLCSHLNGNLKEECEDFVSSYTDELVEMLIDDFKPQEVCVYLKLCKDERPAPPQIIKNHFKGGVSISTNEIFDITANGRPIEMNSQGKKVGNKIECPVCEFIMEKLEGILQDKRTEEEIREAISGVCKIMPGALRRDCDNFFNKYAELILDVLAAGVSPQEICKLMEMCDNVAGSELKHQSVDTIESVSSPQCVLCKIVIHQIEELMGNVSEPDIDNAIRTVCIILPRNQRKECDDFIEKHGAKIYDILSMAVAPGEVCSLLFLCQNPMIAAVKNQAYNCAVCETTVSIIDDILANPYVDHGVEHIFEKSCLALPRKHQSVCRNLMEMYGNTIINYVSNYKAENVCKELRICRQAARPKRAVLVGGSKCTWGPGYWCQNENTAKECGNGAHTHCKTKVWFADKPQN